MLGMPDWIENTSTMYQMNALPFDKHLYDYGIQQNENIEILTFEKRDLVLVEHRKDCIIWQILWWSQKGKRPYF